MACGRRSTGGVLLLCLVLASCGRARTERPPSAAEPPKPFEPSTTSLQFAETLFIKSVEQLQAGRAREATEGLEQALAILVERLPRDDPRLFHGRRTLAETYIRTARLADARKLLDLLLEQSEAWYGATDVRTLELRARLADLLLASYEFARANDVRRRLVSDLSEVYGEFSDPVLGNQSRLATQLAIAGDFVAAEEVLRGVLERWERARPGDPRLTVPRNELAIVLETRGDSEGAERLLRSALESASTLGASVVRVNLGAFLTRHGDHPAAEAELRNALTVRERALGPDHPAVADVLAHLVVVVTRRGRSEEAEALARRVLSIRERAYGPAHPLVAKSHYQLGVLLLRSGADVAAARKEIARAVELGEALDANSPRLALWLAELGGAEAAQRDYAAAERTLSRALELARRGFGSEHPIVEYLLLKLARIHTVVGNPQRALEELSRATELSELLIRRALSSGSDVQRVRFMAQGWLTIETERVLSFADVFGPPGAKELALLTLLRRKGRALDASADLLKKLRSSQSGTAAELDTLAEKRAHLAALSFTGPKGPDPKPFLQRIDDLEREIDDLVRRLSRPYRALVREHEPVTLARIQALLPEGAVLVEFGMHHGEPPEASPLWNPNAGQAEYVAYVLSPRGEVHARSLGPVASLDRSVREARRALAIRSPRAQSVLRELDERVMRPIRELLGSARDVYVAPDGLLNLIPFAALVDENGKYLVESYRFTYLTSGRDLLLFDVPVPSREPPAVYAAADHVPRSRFGAKGPLSRLSFRRIPQAEQEARAVAARFPGALLRTGSSATESSVRKLRGPEILHFAAHGFYLENELHQREAGARGVTVVPSAEDEELEPVASGTPPAMLRSGLVLASANPRGATDEDGILTAVELANVDLLGTQLVVLSACDTGLGEVKSGDALYGMRRALVLAGAQTHVTSLFPVSDTVTRTLMARYYARLTAGDGRSDALRSVALELLAEPRTAHPYYWAPFIVSGNPNALDGSPPGAVRVAPPSSSAQGK